MVAEEEGTVCGSRERRAQSVVAERGGHSLW